MRRALGTRGEGTEGRGTHVLLLVGQQHHRLEAGLLVRGAAGAQLAQEGEGVFLVGLREGRAVVRVRAGPPPRPPARTPPGRRPTLVST